MNLLNTLKKTEALSDFETNIANYILENSRSVINMNIDELSSVNYVSNSSIVRFCQKLGFKGFSDFKIKLASEINSFTLDSERIEIDMPLSPLDKQEDIPKIFLNLYHQALLDVFPHIDMNQITKIAKTLNEATLISLWAQGPSLVAAQDLHYKLKRLGINSVMDPIFGFQYVSPKKRSDKEVAIIITSYGNTKIIKDWLTHHKQVGNETVLVCLNQKSPYLKDADHTVVLDTPEERVNKMGHFASRTIMNYILDVIYTSLFNIEYEANIQVLQRSLKSVEFEE